MSLRATCTLALVAVRLSGVIEAKCSVLGSPALAEQEAQEAQRRANNEGRRNILQVLARFQRLAEVVVDNTNFQHTGVLAREGAKLLSYLAIDPCQTSASNWLGRVGVYEHLAIHLDVFQVYGVPQLCCQV